MTLMRILKRAILGRRPRLKVDPAWAGLERVYRSPPFTEELVAAIRLIAPPCDYPPTERYRDEWEIIQNAACWDEFRTVQPVLDALPKARRILEIGPGLGRSLVFFTKKLGWGDADVHAYEGEGTTTRYTKLGPRFEDSFCGNLRLLKASLEHNGVDNVRIHNAASGSLAALPGEFDLIYSFYSVGFHWSLEFFIDDILKLLSDQGTAIFIVPSSFAAFPKLEPLFLRTVEMNPSEPMEIRRNSLLLLRRHPFPAALHPAA